MDYTLTKRSNGTYVVTLDNGVTFKVTKRTAGRYHYWKTSVAINGYEGTAGGSTRKAAIEEAIAYLNKFAEKPVTFEEAFAHMVEDPAPAPAWEVTMTFTQDELGFIRAGLAAYRSELAHVIGEPGTDAETKQRAAVLRDQCRDLAIRVSNESAAA